MALPYGTTGSLSPAFVLLRLTLFCREVSKSLSEMARIVSLYVSRLKQGGVRDLRLRAGFRSGVLQGGKGQRKRDCRTITVGDLRPITLGSSMHYYADQPFPKLLRVRSIEIIPATTSCRRWPACADWPPVRRAISRTSILSGRCAMTNDGKPIYCWDASWSPGQRVSRSTGRRQSSVTRRPGTADAAFAFFWRYL